MKTSKRGVSLIKEFEGFYPNAYRDPVGIWTIGYGFIEGVQEGDTISRAQAEARLKRELKKYEAGVLAACKVQPNQHEFDALVSFAFNVGVAGMGKSSVVKAHNRGDKLAAARAFSLWNKAGGKVWAGLTRRRAAEAALYLEPVAEVPKPELPELPAPMPQPLMPQAVEPETGMTGSTINRASAIAGGAASVAAVSEVLTAVNQVKSGVEALEAWLVPVLLVAVVGLCAYIIWQRLKQREEGWA